MSTVALGELPVGARKHDYEHKGYILLPQLLTPQISSLQLECERLFDVSQAMSEANLRAQARPNTAGGAVIDRLDPVIDLSPPLRALAADERILSAVRELFEDEALLFKDKVIFKRPGTGGYEVHQDYTVWQEMPAPAEALITVLVAVNDATEVNGAVAFYPGSHDRLYTPPERPHDIFSPATGVVPPEVLAQMKREVVPMTAGDVLLFSSLVPHGSGPNRSGMFRTTVYYSYNAGRYGDLYENYYTHYHEYLRADRADRAGDLHFR
jgi:ectoine hydroxylase-related dioxygenase (phytanoyl-CoA dioxygenase family)